MLMLKATWHLAGYSDRGDLSDVEPHTPIHPDDEFEAPIDTPPHYEERPASDSSSSSLSSRILDALIERVRTLEVEVATLRTDVGDQRRLVKRAIHGGSRRARLMRIVKVYAVCVTPLMRRLPNDAFL